MQAKEWVLSGGIAAVLALLLTYFVLEPAPSVLSYSALLGWNGMVGALVVTIQGVSKNEETIGASRQWRGACSLRA